ncbi:hypothetical protein E8K88_09760 [Lampropedia aestuarii]|uniref:Uncharacterized protein n=1 Tax=Lampropedia aestuarii TaxID=2562762 RepID=A0A4S5BL03_9BURK|nr:hypothetical protein [Lampropedia aestuarii]THJ33207.1 hypothetical protein E8K88_09760 [Lampropedia aestuarii]
MNCHFLHHLRQAAQWPVRVGLSLLLGCALGFAGLAQAQESALPTPQSGIWVVKNPAKAPNSPGRSLAIDVQDSVLLAQIGDYDATGKPMFSVIAGALQADATEPQTVSAVQATLQQYHGGRSLGGPAQSAHLAGSTGEISLRFTSSFTGTAQFPGEPALPIERLQLDTRRAANPDVQTVDAFTGQLHAVDGPQNLLPDASFLLNVTRQAQSGEFVLKLNVSREDMPERFVCDEPPSTAAAPEQEQEQEPQPGTIEQSLRLQCAGEWLEKGVEASLSLEIVGNEVVGQLQYSRTDAQGLTQQARAQLRGVRHFYETNNLRTGESLYYAYSATDVQYVVPQSGIWVIPEELNGEPGRGFAIDVDGDTLALQVFGYEPSGDATFHIGSSPFVPGHISQIELRQPLASTQQNPGKASLSFDSMTTGTIALPGEPARKIVRFALSGPPDARALAGLWRFNVPGKAALSTTLSNVQGSTIRSDDGLFNCSFVSLASTLGQGNTLCSYTPPTEDADTSSYQFIFKWERGLSDFYGQLLNNETGVTAGTGISRIAYLGRDAAAGTLFSVGSQLYLPLRSAPK